MEFLSAHQLNIMLFMSGICGILAFLSCISKALAPKRRRILTLLETAAMLLLLSDWYAYHFRGAAGTTGFWMVRISNFLVFFLTLFMIHEITLYLSDLFLNDAKFARVPRRLIICEGIFGIGTALLLISQFNGLYYFFDETNTYHRGPLNVVSFVIPALIVLIQLSLVIQYRKKLNRLIVISLIINTAVPLIASVVQIFAYGLSLVNMSMVGVAILLYVFVIIDMNRVVENSRHYELELYRKEKEHEHTLFKQTAEALASAIDAKDKYTHGHSSRVADYSVQIARAVYKTDEECEQILFAALLHDVGKIGIADGIINKEGKLTGEEFDQIKLHPVYGYQILSKIEVSPYLSIGARYHHERYDGKGYPDGLVGESIPEIARIIAVADAYDAMTSKRSYRDPIPQQRVREELVKGMGTQFDPLFAKTMIHLIDLDTEYRMQELQSGTDPSFSTGLTCGSLYSACSSGILMNDRITRIHLVSGAADGRKEQTSMPAAVLFDSLDALVPETEAKKKDLLYYEYALIRFDGQVTAGGVRKEKTEIRPAAPGTGTPRENDHDTKEYDLEAVRADDHVLIRITDGEQTVETVLALPDNTRFAYLALTGENCVIRDIRIAEDREPVAADYIPRIAEKISYIDGCPEGDLPNLQIEGWRQVSSEGIHLTEDIRLAFRTKSLPSARLVWHCPFIILFTSADGQVEGKDYREFALIRLDGENWHTDDHVVNETKVWKTDAFPGWEEWKNRLRLGMECRIDIQRDPMVITVQTENLGICIRSEISIHDFDGEIYAALTGDQCTITEIRIARLPESN